MLCAQQVVKVIKDAAKTLNSAETKVTCDTDEPETGLPVIVENK